MVQTCIKPGETKIPLNCLITVTPPLFPFRTMSKRIALFLEAFPDLIEYLPVLVPEQVYYVELLVLVGHHDLGCLPRPTPGGGGGGEVGGGGGGGEGGGGGKNKGGGEGGRI
jgi:uncharacterized membrane protein YgcG